MFGLFKKSRWKIQGSAFSILEDIFNNLPPEYAFLASGLKNGVYKNYNTNVSLKGHFSVGFKLSPTDPAIIKGKSFAFKGIVIKEAGKEFVMNMLINNGLLIDFEIEKNLSDFKNFEIDLSNITIENSPYANSKVEKLVKGLTSDLLDLDDLGEMEIDNKLYYQIKDLEDGNYLAIDAGGKVFRMIHDPYKIEMINASIKQFVSDVNEGKFDFEKYLEKGSGY